MTEGAARGGEDEDEVDDDDAGAGAIFLFSPPTPLAPGAEDDGDDIEAIVEPSNDCVG